MGLGGDYYERVTSTQKSITILKPTEAAPDNDYALWLLGTAYEDVGQFDKAIDAYLKALRVNPNNKDALHDLCIVYIAAGFSAKARAVLPHLFSLDPGYGYEIRALVNRSNSAQLPFR